MKLLVENRFALLGLVLVAWTAIFGFAYATTPRDDAAPAPDPTVVGVESSLRVCPPPAEDRAAEVTAFAAPGDRGPGDGRVSVRENGDADDDEAEIGSVDLTGAAWAEDVSDVDGHTVLRATGTMAGGLAVAQTRPAEDDEPGATTLTCPEPGTSAWFPTPGGDAELELYLANVDDSPSTVNIDIYTPEGPILDPEHTRGITLDSYDERVVELSELTSDVEPVTVHVRTNRGRVAAALHVARSDSGADWAAPATEPAERVVIPGVPSGDGARDLVVAAPGDEPVRATVRVFNTDGEVEHEALEEFDIPPAATVNRTLEGPLDDQAGTVVVEADGPVVAGVAVSRDGGDDTGYLAATPPLEHRYDARGVATAAEDASLELVLGAVDEDAEVTVTRVGTDGAADDPVTVEIPAGRTEIVELPEQEEPAVLVVTVEAGSGPVHAGQVLRWEDDDEDVWTAARPIPPSPDLVALPATTGTLSSAVP